MKLLVLALLVVVLVGCTQKVTISSPKPPAIAPATPPFTIKGIALSPKSFEQTDFTDFFSKAKEANGIVTWSGDWDELGKGSGGGPAVLAQLSGTYGYTPIVEVQFFTQRNGQLIRALDNATKQRYKNEIYDYAGKYKPKYLGVGIEVNTLYEKSPSDFENFVQFYNEIYDGVKVKSPDTEVFTVFQLEKMKGMDGGLFGGTNDPSKAEWQLLDRFPKTDIVAFTTYPDMVYKNPSDIPIDYYSEIRLHTSKQIAFTEIGWHSAASPVGWESSEAEQAQFVHIFFNGTRSLGEQFAVWSFLYDQNTIEPFNSMGLYSADGSQKQAWNAWRSG